MKKTLLFVAVALAFTACSQKSNISLTPAQPKAEVYGFETVPTATFTALCYGVPPLDTYSPAQARALAKRAAIADAQRIIATTLLGVKINAKDTVIDSMLKSSVIEARVHSLIKNAAIVDEHYKDGLYRVELEVQMDKATWERLFAY